MADTANVAVRWISWPPGDGYGDAAAQYVRALDGIGTPVTWTPLTWPPGELRVIPEHEYVGELHEFAHRPIEHDTVVVHLPVDRGRVGLGGGRPALGRVHDVGDRSGPARMGRVLRGVRRRLRAVDVQP